MTLTLLPVIHADPATGYPVWAGGPAGIRTAIERDGSMLGAAATARRASEWLYECSYADPALARYRQRRRGT
jgi:hypothetical protein